jgi:hypothetical protein
MILVDNREKKNLHITDYFDASGIPWRSIKLDQGDYMREGVDGLTIDRKNGLSETYSCMIPGRPINKKGETNHDRFRNECLRAKESGQRLIVLVETHDKETFFQRGVGAVTVSEPTILTVTDVAKWVNPRRVAFSRAKKTGVDVDRQPPIDSATLMRTMQTFSIRYGVEWQFVPMMYCGKKIAEILL